MRESEKSDDLVPRRLFRPVGWPIQTVDANDTIDAVSAQRYQHHFIFSLQFFSEFPAQSFGIPLRHPAAEYGVLNTEPVALHVLGAFSQTIRIVDISQRVTRKSSMRSSTSGYAEERGVWKKPKAGSNPEARAARMTAVCSNP